MSTNKRDYQFKNIFTETENYFALDDIRSKLATEGRIAGLKKTYTVVKKIKNPNSGEFWDSHMKTVNKEGFLDAMTKNRITSAVKLVGINKGKLLDVGFGYGFLENEIIKKRPSLKLHGIDISRKAVISIRQQLHGDFKVGSILDIPYRNNAFDVVLALEVIEHIQSAETFLAYKEIKRVLKPKGQFIASVPINETYTTQFNPNNHLRRYSPQLFIEELKIAGFEIKKVKYFYAFSSFYHIKKLLSLILLRKWKPNILLVSAVNR